jgi:hypothetical protein
VDQHRADFFSAEAGIASASQYMLKVIRDPDLPRGVVPDAERLHGRIRRLMRDMGAQGDALRARTADDSDLTRSLRWARTGLEGVVRFLTDASRRPSVTPADTVRYRRMVGTATGLLRDLDRLARDIAEQTNWWYPAAEAGRDLARAWGDLTQGPPWGTPALTRTASYHIRHQPSAGGPPVHDLVGDAYDFGLPPDGLERPERYTGFRQHLRSFWPALLAAQGNPSARVTIYRALSSGHTTFDTGNWVTLSLGYAQQHLESNVEGGHIVAVTVPAHTVRFAGDDLMEWGYWGPPVDGRVVGGRTAARPDVDCYLDAHGLGDLVRGGSATLYHGTTRSFQRFDSAYVRHELIARFYKAPGIFLSPKRGVAAEYSAAARNTMIPATVVDDLTRINRGAGEVMGTLVTQGPDAWSGLFEDAVARFPDAATPADALERVTGGVDPNTLMDIAEYVEGSRYAKGADETLFDLWGMIPTGTPDHVFTDMDSVGLDTDPYRPKVYTVEVSGLGRVLVTKSKSEAAQARRQGYDAVVFCGADLVRGVPEVVVFDPSKVRVTKVDVLRYERSDDDGYYNVD